MTHTVKTFLFLAFGVLGLITTQAHAQQEGIAVVVNDSAITYSDVNDRMRLIMASSGLPPTEEMANKIRPQILNTLIDEQLMIQEAARIGQKASAKDVQNGFANLAVQNQKTPEEFTTMMQRGGINVSTMYTQIESQIAWTKFIQSEIRPKIIVSAADIDQALERIQDTVGKTEYLLAEIFLPVDTPNEESNIQNLANKLVSEINSGKAPFFKIAQQFSKAAGAEQGGNLGWTAQGQLSSELDTQLPLIEKNSISTPIRSKTGYHIIMVRDTRVVDAEALPSREDVLEKLGLEHMERMAGRHLMDVKAAAYIDNRGV